jgi:hypothetical protein
MLTVGDVAVRNCRGISRRELMRVGGISLPGLSLADALRGNTAAAEGKAREVSCIFLWLDGGPSHFETFDPKPDAPADSPAGISATCRV